MNYTRIAAQPDVDAALAHTEPSVLRAVVGRGSDAADSNSGPLATVGGAGEATVAVADTVLAPPRVRGLSSSGCEYAVAPPSAQAQSQVATGRTSPPIAHTADESGSKKPDIPTFVVDASGIGGASTPCIAANDAAAISSGGGAPVDPSTGLAPVTYRLGRGSSAGYMV